MTRRVLVATIATLLLCQGVASAAFGRSAGLQAATFSTLTVAPVTNLAGTASCGPALSLKAKVVLTWTATTSTRATSYEVRRRLVAVTTSVASVSIGTNTYTDNSLAVATTFGYIVRTYVGSWYADSSETLLTTPAVCT